MTEEKHQIFTSVFGLKLIYFSNYQSVKFSMLNITLYFRFSVSSSCKQGNSLILKQKPLDCFFTVYPCAETGTFLVRLSSIVGVQSPFYGVQIQESK